MTPGEVASIRDKLWDCDFRPVAVYSSDHSDRARAGKAPLATTGQNWRATTRPIASVIGPSRTR